MTKPIAQVLAVTVSPMFTAILDYALDNQRPRTSPRIKALAITRDGFLVGWNDENPLAQVFIGAVSAFEANVKGVCATCGLTQDETEVVVAFAFSRVADWRIWGRRGANPFREVR